MLRGLLVAVVLIAAAMLLTTCGGGHKHAMNPTTIGSGGFQAADNPAAEVSLDDALAELDALPTPDGVDPSLFQQLKDALRDALVANPPGRRGSLAPLGKEPGWLARPTHGVRKFVSTPPTGDPNRVTDLTITDIGDGTYTLTWHYRNLGDYDQNGIVGISDITPIAMHYGETYDIEDENCLLAVIDGSGPKRLNTNLDRRSPAKVAKA